MNSVRASAPQLADITPYDPKYLPARAYLSANENPSDVETEVRNEIKRELTRWRSTVTPNCLPTSCAT